MPHIVPFKCVRGDSLQPRAVAAGPVDCSRPSRAILGIMESLLRDVRYALATLRRTPGLTFTVLVTLALGVGATTAVFTVVHAVLLEPLPYPDSAGSFGCGKSIPAANRPPAIAGSV